PFPGTPRLGAVAFGVNSTGKGYYGLGYDTTGYWDTMVATKGYHPVTGMPFFQDSVLNYRTNFLTDWWEYDAATQTWTRLNDFPREDLYSDTIPNPWMGGGYANAAPFSLDASVSVGGAAPRNFAGGFMFGEYYDWISDSSGFYQGFNDTPFFYDAAADQWVAGPTLPATMVNIDMNTQTNPYYLSSGRSNAAAIILDY